jgi:hypothetical protein
VTGGPANVMFFQTGRKKKPVTNFDIGGEENSEYVTPAVAIGSA